MEIRTIKPIAFYLPQYHRIPENDSWWGEGFTEWTNLKKAKPLFDGHYQPRVPLNENYYNLLDTKVQIWQSDIAQKHGIYGFCYYHYWFDGHMLLEKPAENMLKEPKITIPFCFCWANENWTKAWVNSQSTVLIAQNYGGREEWIRHFYYFLPFFKDSRYIKEGNKPFFVIYRPELIDKISEMLDCWKEEAKKNGFDGMVFAFQTPSYRLSKTYNPNLFDYGIEYQPTFANMALHQNFPILRKMKREFDLYLEKHLHLDARSSLATKVKFSDYDKVWNEIVHFHPQNPKEIAGAFVDWDNTPRRGHKGMVFTGANPEKFGMYIKQQVFNIQKNYSNPYLFIFAWNEWTEGGYLEPDEKFHYRYLEEFSRALKEAEQYDAN